MSLIYIDGFDIYNNIGEVTTRYSTNLHGKTTLTTGRGTGGNNLCLSLIGVTPPYTTHTAHTTITTPTFTGVSTVYTGFAFHNSSLGNGPVTIARLQEGTTIHLDLVYHPKLKVLEVTRNGTSLAVGTTQLATNAWYYIEIKAIINSSTGSVIVHLNTATEINITNQNTRNGGTGVVNNIAFTNTGSGTWLLDDLYILNSSGGVNNTFLGDMTVEGLSPSAAGTNTNFTPVGTGSNYIAAQGGNSSEYLESSTSLVVDTYLFTNLSRITGSVAGVCIDIEAQNSNSTQHSTKATVYNSTTVYPSGTTITIPNTAKTFNQTIFETNPHTATTWTPSDVNTTEFGVKMIT